MAEAVADGAETVADDYVVDARRDRLVIFASTLGTVFEWYDFFVYGTLATVIAKLFFPSANATAGLLSPSPPSGGLRSPAGRRALFGWLGDRLGANTPSSSPSP
jgi:MFS family permease